MGILDKEEVVAPSQNVVAPKPTAVKVECTRDTRGDAPCAVKDCENCN